MTSQLMKNREVRDCPPPLELQLASDKFVRAALPTQEQLAPPESLPRAAVPDANSMTLPLPRMLARVMARVRTPDASPAR